MHYRTFFFLFLHSHEKRANLKAGGQEKIYAQIKSIIGSFCRLFSKATGARFRTFIEVAARAPATNSVARKHDPLKLSIIMIHAYHLMK